jgi:hypothetical protein
MVKAMDVVDGIGIGRPAAQEPRFANDLLSGRILSAIKPVKMLEDIGMGFRLAGTQMGQIGRGEEPLDASDAKTAGEFLLDQGRWYDAMLSDADKLTGHGNVSLSTPQRPYGQVDW